MGAARWTWLWVVPIAVIVSLNLSGLPHVGTGAAAGLGALVGTTSGALPIAPPTMGASTALGWENITSSNAPPARYAGAMAFDPALNETVYFGGAGCPSTGCGWTDYNDTWVERAGVWTNLTSQLSPAPSTRAFASMAYDSTDGYLLFFGGNPGTRGYNDTWTFTSSGWTLLSTPVAPPPLDGMVLVPVPGAGLVLFGGRVNGTGLSSETWQFLRGSWTNLTSQYATAPSPRMQSAADYDPLTRSILLYGGYDSNGFEADTWNFTLAGGWAQLSPGGSTLPAMGAEALVWDPALQTMVLYGGRNYNGALASTYFFANDTWTLESFSAGGSPGQLGAMSATYDPTLPGVLIVGGDANPWNVPPSSGVWELTGSVSASPVPSPRAGAAFAYDPASRAYILFGGENVSGCAGTTSAYCRDTWSYSSGTWTELHPTSAPPARADAAFAYSPTTKRLVLFGGIGRGGAVLGDTWTFSDGIWKNVTASAGHPPARSGASLTFDAYDSYLMLFGGRGPSGLLGDTWKFAGGFWSQIGTCGGPTQPGCGATAPSPRSLSATAYDAAQKYVLLFGGEIGSKPRDALADTWTYSAGVWTNRTASTGTSPTPRDAASVTYDATTKSVLLFGGLTFHGKLSDATWEWTGGHWAQFTHLSSSPSARQLAPMSYDTSTGQAILFGGSSCAGALTAGCSLDDVWTFNSAGWVSA